MFDIEVYVLVIDGSNMVFGIHWLKTLGSILWNSSDLTIQFKIGQKEVRRGRSTIPRQDFAKCS